jgi:hypothetical protein
MTAQQRLKRIWVLPLLLVVALVLAACGTAETTADVEPTAEPTAEPTSGDTDDPTAEPTAEPTSGDADDPTTEPTAESTSGDTDNTGSNDTADTQVAAAPSATPEPTDTPAPSATPEPSATPTPAGPVALKSGTFNVIDNQHSGTGTATILEQPDGSHILRFDANFSVTFGPDLFVWLSGHPEPRTSGESQNQGYVNLGSLQSRNGAQEYTIPADVDVEEFESALVWCRAFSQVMTSAALTSE